MSEARDICTSNIILQAVSSFKLKQKITKDTSLDLGPYADLISEMTIKSPQFEQAVTNYTQDLFYSSEEPLRLFPLGNDRVLFVIQAISKQIDIECRKLKSRMLTIDLKSDIPYITEAMRLLEIDDIPLMYFSYGGIISTMDGRHQNVPPSTADLTKIPQSWIKLHKDGSFVFPTTDESTVKIKAFCFKNSNFWESNPSKQKIFKNLMTKVSREFTGFNSNLGRLTKYLANKSKNDTAISLLPPVQLSRLGALISKYSEPRNWEISLPTDIGTFTEIYELFKFTAKTFKKLTNSTFNVDPRKTTEIFQIDNSKFVPVSEIQILKDSVHGLFTVSTDVVDITDIYTVYRIKQNIQTGTMPNVKYAIYNGIRMFLFDHLPELASCNGVDEDIVCEGWASEPIMPQCIDYVTGKTKKSTNDCELSVSSAKIKAIRTDCFGPNSVVLSCQIKDPVILFYCDSVYTKSLTLQNPYQVVQSNCEIRFVDNEIERIILGQLNTDLIDPVIITEGHISEPAATSEIELQLIILYSVPIGIGVIILMFILICVTGFCFNPLKFQELLKCMAKSKVNSTPLPSRANSNESMPLRSVMPSPSASRAHSRSASPARSLIGNKAIISSF